MEAYKGTVLLIDNDTKLNDTNSHILESCGYEVYSALTLAKARWCLSWLEPDIILLEAVLPDGNGFEFCKEIRNSTMAHIMFLTIKTTREDMLHGMSVGADAYINKPFYHEEMLIKIEAAMRRHRSDQNLIIKKGSLTLDITTIQAFNAGDPLQLTPTEFSLLLILAKNEGRTLSSDFIYETVWRSMPFENKNALQAAISKLRRKIEHTGYCITAQRNRGYIFEKF